MVRIHFQIRKQKGLATRLVTCAAGFQSHEDSINLVQHLGVVELQDPALLAQGTLVNGLNMAGCGGWNLNQRPSGYENVQKRTAR